MLLTVVVLGGVILGATTIAGLLMIYQVRQSTNVTDSTKAIFAADAGVELSLYNRFKNPNYTILSILDNKATFAIIPTGLNAIKSVGTAGKSNRAFEVRFIATQCSDGIDNDGDGLIDFNPVNGGDPDCLAPGDNDESDGGGGGGGEEAEL